MATHSKRFVYVNAFSQWHIWQKSSACLWSLVSLPPRWTENVTSIKFLWFFLFESHKTLEILMKRTDWTFACWCIVRTGVNSAKYIHKHTTKATEGWIYLVKKRREKKPKPRNIFCVHTARRFFILLIGLVDANCVADSFLCDTDHKSFFLLQRQNLFLWPENFSD